MAEADAVVFHVPSLKLFWRPPKPKGQIWVASSMESEVNYPRLGKRGFLRHFDLTMTYRLDSDLPITYVSYYSSAANLARAVREPPRTKTQLSPASSFVSSNIDVSRRQTYLRELSKHLPIDSYGSFMRTHRIENDRGRPSKLEVIGGYKLNLAFENSRAHDYVTEKFFDPLVAGSVPVYLGAPNVADFAPGERCFVDVTAFAGPRALAEYLLHLCNDPAEYESYHAWRTKPFLPGFQRLIDTQGEPTILRLFERVRQMRG
jgi:hypothetical protein